MSQILSKAPRRPQETRSQAGIGMGSHSPFRELVGRSMRFVQNPNERMGFGQREGGRAVSLAGQAEPYAPRCSRLIPRMMTPALKGTPCPPRSPGTSGGHPQFFPCFLSQC